MKHLLFLLIIICSLFSCNKEPDLTNRRSGWYMASESTQQNRRTFHNIVDDKDRFSSTNKSLDEFLIDSIQLTNGEPFDSLLIHVYRDTSFYVSTADRIYLRSRLISFEDNESDAVGLFYPERAITYNSLYFRVVNPVDSMTTPGMTSGAVYVDSIENRVILHFAGVYLYLKSIE